MRRDGAIGPSDTSKLAAPLSAHVVVQRGSVGAIQLGRVADAVQGRARPARARPAGARPARARPARALPAREGRPTRPAIVSCLADAANILTLFGLGCSGAAIFAAVNRSFHLAGLLMIGAYLADLFDGPLARGTKHRSTDLGSFGASLDSLADLVGCGVTPSVVLLVYAGSDPWWVFAAAAALLGATAVRLAYFDTHGLDESGRYLGVPTDFVILFFSGLLLLEGWVGAAAFAGVLASTAAAAAALMVSPVRVPRLTGVWYFCLPAIALLIATGHLVKLAS